MSWAPDAGDPSVRRRLGRRPSQERRRTVTDRLPRRRRDRPGWEFTANFWLGQHWREMGDYARAQAAYELARASAPQHGPTLYNLAVVQLRRGLHEAALQTLDDLSGAAELPTKPPDRGRWPDALFTVAYQRVLALDYLEEFEEASKWSEPLAEHALPEPDGSGREEATVGGALKLPALMLHAGTLVQRDRDSGAAEEAAHELLKEDREAPKGAPALDKPAEIARYVRSRPRVDARAHYNVACFLARLVDMVDSEVADELVPLAVDELGWAVSDPGLLSWSHHDPSLDPIRGTEEWTVLSERVEPAAAEARTADAGATRTEPPAVNAGAINTASPAAPTERDEAVDEAVAALRDHYALAASPPALTRLERLREDGGLLSPRRFEIELAACVAACRDPGTIYHLPPDRDAGEAMALPFTLAELDGRYYVATSEGGPPVDALVTDWNGVPIKDAVELRARRIGAPTADARRARALATLTHRPARFLAPFAEGDVEVGYEHRRESDASTFEWEPAPVASDEQAPLWSLDPLVHAVAEARGEELAARELPDDRGVTVVRIPTFCVEREEIDATVGEIEDEAVGVVVDLRGNPGGSLFAADRLLALVCGKVPERHVEFRASPAVRDLVGGLQPHWDAALEGAIDADDFLTPPLSIPTEWPPDVERRTLVVLVDALCGGAAADLALRVAEHRLGHVVSTVPDPGLEAGLTAVVDGAPRLSVTYARLVRTSEAFEPRVARGEDPLELAAKLAGPK